LNISNNKVGPASESLSQMLIVAGSSLKSLSLREISSNLDVIINAIAKGCPNLEECDISKNKLKPDDTTALLAYIKNASSLRMLNLAGVMIGPVTLKQLLCNVSNNIDLKIDLRENNLGFQGAQMIASIPFDMTNIIELNLADNELGEEGISVLCEGLCSNTTIKSLILDRNLKGDKKFREICILNLQKLINSNKYIESLSFAGGNKPTQQLKTDIVPFLYSLGNNNTLTSIDISCHQMGNKGAIALAKSLHINHTLTTIKWDENLVASLGFVTMQNALKENTVICDMPLPTLDLREALKKEQEMTQKAINKIEKYILRNQGSEE